MSMFLLPITLALLGTPHGAPASPAAPSASSVRDAAGSELMEEVWRRYRRLASASVTASGIRRYANGRIEPIRTTIPLHRRLLDTHEFRDADFDIHYVERHLKGE